MHTTGLLVKEAAEEEDPPPGVTRRIHGVRLYGPSLRWIDLDVPGYYFLATDTPALLRSLAERASEAGAELRCGAASPAGRSGRILVGADGPRSGVARGAGLGRNRAFLAGVEAEFDDVEGVDERLHVFLDSQLAPGYIGWVVPGVGLTQVGLASRLPARPNLDRFIARVARVFDFDRARRMGTRGGLIPVGGTVRPFATRDVVLVGDAAGLVSPLTAGGIHRRSAQVAPPGSRSRATSSTGVPRSTPRSATSIRHSRGSTRCARRSTCARPTCSSTAHSKARGSAPSLGRCSSIIGD